MIDRAPPAESFLVFSDVHLGSDLDDCDRQGPRRSSVDKDLVDLLVHYRETPPEAERWHLVVAGDFIDFIGMTVKHEGLATALTEEERAHGLGGAADHACEKLRRVAHRHADVFAALAAFVAAGHAVTFVHGNHDIELHWDAVKDGLRAALLAEAPPDVAADAFLGRIAFSPWFFWRDGVAFIEHGHQYDPFCASEHVMAPISPADPRRSARGFGETLLRFVVRPTRGMTESGHEHTGLSYYLRFGANLGVRGAIALGVRFARAVRELFRIRAASLSEAAAGVRAEHERRVAQLATASRVGIERLRALLALQSRPITSTVHGIMKSVLLDRLALALAAVIVLLAMLFVSPLACLAVLPAWAIVHVVLARGRHVDPAAQMVERAAHLAKLFPAAFVVMGHTHVPVMTPAGGATYVNVGSWAEDEEGAERAARTHLVIHVREDGAEAQFRRWGATGPERV